LRGAGRHAEVAMDALPTCPGRAAAETGLLRRALTGPRLDARPGVRPPGLRPCRKP
jgi:hypothetical protein